MNKLEQFKKVLFDTGFEEKKKGLISKVYTKEFEGEKVQLGMLYKITPTKIKFYTIDSLGHSHLRLTAIIKKLKFDNDGSIDFESWKEYKGKEKSKIYNFNEL